MAQPSLTEAVHEMELARRMAWRALPQAGIWRGSLLASGAVALWSWNNCTGHVRGFGDLCNAISLAIAGGFAWAGIVLDRRCRAQFRKTVLPRLADASDWTWRPQRVDLEPLRRHGWAPRWDDAEVRGVLAGTRRGCRVAIAALQLTCDVRGEADETVFRGLLVTAASADGALTTLSLTDPWSVDDHGLLVICLPTVQFHFAALGLLRRSADQAALASARADLAAVLATVDRALDASLASAPHGTNDTVDQTVADNR